jgi:hypothetical protein
VASLLAQSGWGYVLDRILAGVCHDLNGRVSSLQAVTQLLALGEPLPDTFHTEPEQLADIARFVALIPSDLGAEPIPIAAEEILHTAVDLHARVRGAIVEPTPLEILEGVPPVLVNRGRAVRGAILLTDYSMRSLPEPDRPIRLGGDSVQAIIEFPVGDAGSQDPDLLEPLARLFEIDGGDLQVTHGQLLFRLPSLAAARAAGR